MMVLVGFVQSPEIQITEDWHVVKIVGSRDNLEAVEVGDIVEYVPSWSEYKLSDLDRQMYNKGFRYKRILVMKNNEGIELVNELMPVILDTTTPISEGKMRDDCGDLRFYWWNGDSQAWEEISYWIDNDTVNSDETKVILRIPRVEANGYVNIVVYYGAKHYGRKDDLSIAYGARAYEGKYLSFDGVDDEVRIDFSEYVDTFEGGISNWTVVTKTSDSVSNVTQSSDYRHDGSYSARFEAYLDGISTNGYDWNDMRQSDYMDWSDCVGVGFWIYVPDSSVGVNAVLGVGFYDSDGTEIWKHGVMRFSDVSSGWYYVEIYKDELDTPVGGDEVINWKDSRLSIRIHSSDSSLDGTTVVVYIDEVKKLRMDKRTYTIISYHKIREDTNEWTTGRWRYWVVGADLHNVAFMEWGHWVQNQLMKFFYEDRTNITSSVSGSEGIGVHMSFIRKDGLTVEQGVFDKGLNSSLTLDNSKGLRSFDRLRIGLRAPVDGIYYFVYNRYVDDTELQTIYENPNDPPRAGLVLWLAPDSVDDVNGKWLDKSELGNDGTINGATPVEVRTFEESVQTSKVLEFDGVDDVVNVGQVSEIENGGSFTLRAKVWIDYDNQNEDHAHIVDYVTDAYSEGTWFLRYSKLENDTIQWFVYGDNGAGTVTPESRIEYQISSDGWYDIVAVYDAENGQIKLYVDGTYIDSRTKTSIVYGNVVTGLNIGGLWKNSSVARQLFGNIKDVMLWNRVLSGIEIQNLYNNPNNPPLDGLVLWLDGTSIDETNGKWLNKAPALKSGYVEPLDGTINGATPMALLSSAWSEEIDMNNGLKIVWKGKVVKKITSSNSVVLYVKTANMMNVLGEVV